MLIVDDAIVMGHLIRQYLAQLGFSQIVEAEDGQIALEKLGNEKVDFIISDWPMPNLGGLQLLKKSGKWRK